MSGWLGNYSVAAAAASKVSEKALGGRVTASFNPATGRGQSVRAHVARSRGIFVDEQGRLRCGQNGEFTDLDRSNCVDDAAQAVVQRVASLLEGVPDSMNKIRVQLIDGESGYLPSRSVRVDADDAGVSRDLIVQDYVELLDAGLDVRQVPDAVLWDAMERSDRFKIKLLTHDDDDGDDVPTSGVNFTSLVTDTVGDKQYFVKQETASPEGPLTEMIVNEYAHEMGLPVGSFRFANDGSSYEELRTLQEHVGDHVSTELVTPFDGPNMDEIYRPEETFGKHVPHNVDNVASALVLDWVSANADRNMGNFFVTRSDDGEVHVVPIDHGFAFDAATRAGDESPEDFLRWATHDDLGGNQSAGFLHVLAEQEKNGFSTRTEILDALDTAIGRAQAIDGKGIDKRSRERLPDGYSEIHEPTAKTVYGGMGKALDTRSDGLSAATREQLNEAIDRIVKGESTREGSRLRGSTLEMESPGVTVRKDSSLEGMDEEAHRLRQPNGVLVRGTVINRNDVPPETFRVDFFEGEDAVSAGPVNEDGIHVGFNPLYTDEESAATGYFDAVLYRDLSTMWSDDNFDEAFTRLSEEAVGYGFEYITEERARDLWDRGEPVKMMELLWGPRYFYTDFQEPFIDPDLRRFFDARNLPEPSMITVPREAVPNTALITQRGGVVRVYGDLDFAG